MPRVTAAHEEHVRARIAEAALRAFTSQGFHQATIQDVVRESGLSVGAIYSYFGSKDELLLAACELSVSQELQALAAQMGSATSVRQKLEIAVRFWFDYLEREWDGARFMAQAWAEAFSQEGIRQMLVRRRERLVGVGSLLLQEAIARGELRDDLEVDSVARGFGALLDGLVLQRLEEGEAFRRPAAERRALAFIDILYDGRRGDRSRSSARGTVAANPGGDVEIRDDTEMIARPDTADRLVEDQLAG
jgi:AcrR family transcriptional regulator